MIGPDPLNPHPVEGFPRVCFLKNVVKNPNICVGDYTYYDDPQGGESFEKNVLYHYPFIGDKLIIGKFCALATGVRFIMNGANHYMKGFSSYPFNIFGCGWEKGAPSLQEYPRKGDTVIENDVWIGYQSTIMAGVKIGNGAIIASGSLVAKDVPAYSIVGGNPSQIIRYRFDSDMINILEEVAWWNWPIEVISENLNLIRSQDIQGLYQVAYKLNLI